MRNELETVLDTLEGWQGDEDSARDEIIEMIADAHERAAFARRLYELGPWLTEFALSIWPSDEQQSSDTKPELS